MTVVAYNTGAHQFIATPAGAVGEDCTHLSAHTDQNGGTFLDAIEIDTDPDPLALGQRLEIPAGRLRFIVVPRGADRVSGGRITDPGEGYTSVPNVVFSGGGGSGAAAVAVLDGDGVGHIEITDPGEGYTSAPNIALNGGGATTVATAESVLSIAGTDAMAEREVRGMIAGGVWVQGHTGPPGANGTDNPLTDIVRIQIAASEFTVETL